MCTKAKINLKDLRPNETPTKNLEGNYDTSMNLVEIP